MASSRFYGIDLGGTKAQVWSDQPQQSIAYEEHSEGKFAGLPDLRRRELTVEFIGSLIKTYDLHGSIGLALPATIVTDKDTGTKTIPSTVTKFAELSGEIHVTEKELSEKLQRPITICNDGDAVAMSAFTIVGSKEGKVRNMSVTTLGTSLGQGFIFDARPYQGPYTSRASHMIIDPNGPWCVKEHHRGCWKSLASNTARLDLAKSMGLVQDGAARDSKNIADEWAATRDDALKAKCQLFFAFFAERVALGLANIASLLPVDCLVISGGVANADAELLLNPIVARLQRGDILDYTVAKNLRVVCAPSANVAHGAALLAVNRQPRV